MLKKFSKRVLKCFQKSTSAKKGFRKFLGKFPKGGSKNLQNAKKFQNKSFPKFSK